MVQEYISFDHLNLQYCTEMYILDRMPFKALAGRRDPNAIMFGEQRQVCAEQQISELKHAVTDRTWTCSTWSNPNSLGYSSVLSVVKMSKWYEKNFVTRVKIVAEHGAWRLSPYTSHHEKTNYNQVVHASELWSTDKVARMGE